ncbi:alpha/beta hydrolase [Mesobaculum littorinae]|uniref:Alpha/beta hydrolase n=1 Tax=Mesobaculum littorinae TaxID=2486419 RepID=A0A438AMY6_9RHOB|nr:alpha/beta hydrolase [Mesobaculum littorinae]
MPAAPYHADVAQGPDCGAAVWLETRDGVRLRMGHWRTGTAGTVLIFPGRTEYIEKYGDAAAEFAKLGYSSIAMDWRGQGLADRLGHEALSGHVLDFGDYQTDVAAMMTALRYLDMPKPYHLVAHSMGGAIGLRALTECLPVASAVFTAPMWGIGVAAALRPLAWTLSWGMRSLGLGDRYTPGTSGNSYVNVSPFEKNLLTRDRAMFDYMATQTATHPELALGGPSLHWVSEALKECRWLDRQPSPSVPALTFLGGDEGIVDPAAIHDRMQRWPGGRLTLVEGGRHEVMMETPEARAAFFAAAGAHFRAAAQDGPEDRGAGAPDT